jgi:beta-glucosidase
MKKLFFLILLGSINLTPFAQKKWSESPKGTFNLIKNPNGQSLGYSPNSGIKILTVSGLAFKDLNKNGKLDKFEDWRLPADVRAKDLATKL